jgi:RimJ/RimL family protein N-acetyltransferase
VLGIQAVNGQGETIRSGGRVMKNVTGYDLARGLAGSWGTLAVMTEVALKVLPVQREMRTVLCFGLTDPTGVQVLSAALGTPYEVSGTVHVHAGLAEHFSDQEIANAGASVTAIRVENFPASARYRSSRLKHMMQAYAPALELDRRGRGGRQRPLQEAAGVLRPAGRAAGLSGSRWPAPRALDTPRLRLEPLLEAHATALFAGISDPVLYAHLDEAPPVSAAALAERYRFLEARCSPDGGEAWLNWALRERASAALVGTVQAAAREREAEIAYVLLRGAWGRGLASEAVAALLALLRSDFAAREFVAHVDPRNARSVNLLERLGFARSGTRAASSPLQPEPDLVFRRGG